jgi:hypothetical protein
MGMNFDTMRSNKARQPTQDGAAVRPEDFRGSAVAVHAASRRWLGSFR